MIQSTGILAAAIGILFVNATMWHISKRLSTLEEQTAEAMEKVNLHLGAELLAPTRDSDGEEQGPSDK